MLKQKTEALIFVAVVPCEKSKKNFYDKNIHIFRKLYKVNMDLVEVGSNTT